MTDRLEVFSVDSDEGGWHINIGGREDTYRFNLDFVSLYKLAQHVLETVNRAQADDPWLAMLTARALKREAEIA